MTNSMKSFDLGPHSSLSNEIVLHYFLVNYDVFASESLDSI